ncbi:jg19081 [Pararge aegeria aegeria]|uniref:Jg19081 protein n=1 Tax=Pararge aegeria aegeria TaxID=348720 RepID=A0A8S4SR15_9NEOP|nr:jg19081 [Pararge aegeria aegeria]
MRGAWEAFWLLVLVTAAAAQVDTRHLSASSTFDIDRRKWIRLDVSPLNEPLPLLGAAATLMCTLLLSHKVLSSPRGAVN